MTTKDVKYIRNDTVAELTAQRDELLAACKDLLSGWIYIRKCLGDLYGVGWARAEEKANAAIEKATK